MQLIAVEWVHFRPPADQVLLAIAQARAQIPGAALLVCHKIYFFEAERGFDREIGEQYPRILIVTRQYPVQIGAAAT